MRFHEQNVEAVLGLLEQQPYWTSRELARRLNVSRSTVQRCLGEIHELGLGERIHGGIRKTGSLVSAPTPVSERAHSDRRAKDEIARIAIDRLPASGSVYLDAGTTVLPLAKKLDPLRHKHLYYVTNDVAIALVLARKNLSHTLLSGSIHPVTQVISGAISQKQIGEFHFDACFLSVDAVDPKGVAACALAEEAALKHRVLLQSRSKILVASFSKWQKSSAVAIAPLKCFTEWITERASRHMKKICTINHVALLVSKGGKTHESR